MHVLNCNRWLVLNEDVFFIDFKTIRDDLELKCYNIEYVSLQVRISKLLNEAGTHGHEMFLVRRYMYSVAFKSLGHIPMRQNPEPESNSLLSLRERFQGVIQLQKDQRQPSTTPHSYIATRQTRLGNQRNRMATLCFCTWSCSRTNNSVQ